MAHFFSIATTINEDNFETQADIYYAHISKLTAHHLQRMDAIRSSFEVLMMALTLPQPKTKLFGKGTREPEKAVGDTLGVPLAGFDAGIVVYPRVKATAISIEYQGINDTLCQSMACQLARINTIDALSPLAKIHPALGSRLGGTNAGVHLGHRAWRNSRSEAESDQKGSNGNELDSNADRRHGIVDRGSRSGSVGI